MDKFVIVDTFTGAECGTRPDIASAQTACDALHKQLGIARDGTERFVAEEVQA